MARCFMRVHTSENPEENREHASDCLPAEIMTAAEVARYLHCSKAHVYNAINRENRERASPAGARARAATAHPARSARIMDHFQ